MWNFQLPHTTRLSWIPDIAGDGHITNVGTNIGINIPAPLPQPLQNVKDDNGVINEATSAAAGVMTTTMHDKLDGIAAGAQVNVATNLGTSVTGSGVTVTSSTGNNATISGATASAAGLVTTGNQTFEGTKTFNNNIVASVTGNAATANSAGAVTITDESSETNTRYLAFTNAVSGERSILC